MMLAQRIELEPNNAQATYLLRALTAYVSVRLWRGRCWLESQDSSEK